MLIGDIETGKSLVRNYINATVGPAPSLMRMFGPKGNPSAKNLFGGLAQLEQNKGTSFALRPIQN